MLNSFPMNGHTLKFCPLNQKLEKFLLPKSIFRSQRVKLHSTTISISLLIVFPPHPQTLTLTFHELIMYSLLTWNSSSKTTPVREDDSVLNGSSTNSLRACKVLHANKRFQLGVKTREVLLFSLQLPFRFSTVLSSSLTKLGKLRVPSVRALIFGFQFMKLLHPWMGS